MLCTVDSPSIKKHHQEILKASSPKEAIISFFVQSLHLHHDLLASLKLMQDRVRFATSRNVKRIFKEGFKENTFCTIINLSFPMDSSIELDVH
ncbi:hypothetical protein LENED_006793 [Lentinula edodes]|uniref:Uncharacterized protein n=1 Tax=Lentinula edodes TaxID=5353 RepID=A0A1Q3ECN1_LENED|nr:hypothetical protein LENED_006793 [Lentinula edodes]